MYIQQSVYGCLMVVYRFGIQLPPPPLSPRVVWSKLSPPFVFPVTWSLALGYMAAAGPLVRCGSGAGGPAVLLQRWPVVLRWWIRCRVRCKGWTRGAYPLTLFPSFTSCFTSCLSAQKKGAVLGPLFWCLAGVVPLICSFLAASLVAGPLKI